MKIHYPSYLNKKDESLQNAGDITVPEGSILSWEGMSKNTAWVKVAQVASIKKFLGTQFKFESKAKNSMKLKILLANAFSGRLDSTSFQITVIKDA